MTCASCAGRVERALREVPGVVNAGVNLANERATVRYLAGEVETSDLEKAVEVAGYGVVRGVDEGGEETAEDARERDYRDLRRDFVLAAALRAVRLVGSLPRMFGVPLSMPVLNWAFLALATPVQFWAGRRFYRGAWGALRHVRANMSTLVVVGTSAAYLYSAVATLAPGHFGGRRVVPRSTRPARSVSRRPRSERTRRSRRSSAWSRRPRARRPRYSASPTVSAPSSCPPSWRSPPLRSSYGSFSGRGPRSPSRC